MTAATLSRLPLAGGTLVGSLGRAGGWMLVKLIDGGFWTVGQFMRAPIAITAVAAVAGFSVLAGSNALYFQSGRHPAPLFFAPTHPAFSAPVVRPVVPASRPHLLPASIDTETTGSVGMQPASDVIGTAEILALQQKLVALTYLGVAPDGHFGRRTAAAIRAFEANVGMKVDGKPTRAVFAAAAAASAQKPQPLPAAESLAPATAVATAHAAPLSLLTATPLAVAQNAAPIPLAPAPELASAAAPAPRESQASTTPVPDTFAANSAVPADAAAVTPAATVAPPASTEGTAARENLVAGGSSVAMAAAPVAPGIAAPAAVAAADIAPAAAAATPPTADSSLSAAQKLAAEMGTLPPEATASNTLAPATVSDDDSDGSTDPVLISKIQRALASLGFLAAKIDGVPGEGTAKAIRNFEVFYDYKITGLATHQLLDLLIQHGAVI